MSLSRRRFRTLFLLAATSAPLAIGCGSSADNPPPATPSAPTDASIAPKSSGPCATAADCKAMAKKTEAAGDKAKMREIYGYSCEQNDPDACVSLGADLDKDDPKKLELFKKACGLKNANGCFDAAENLRHSDPPTSIGLYKKACEMGGETRELACGRGAKVAYEAQDFDSSKSLAGHLCGSDSQAACGLLGVMAANGNGEPKDLTKAGDLFDKGCKGGDEEACGNAKQLASMSGSKGGDASSAAGLTVDDANLSMGSMSADGFNMRDIGCKTEDTGLGALMAGPAIAGAVASKKAQLRACSPKGGDARVRFKMHGGHTSSVEAKASSPAVEACVVKVMKTVPGLMGATCAVTLDLNK